MTEPTGCALTGRTPESLREGRDSTGATGEDTGAATAAATPAGLNMGIATVGTMEPTELAPAMALLERASLTARAKALPSVYRAGGLLASARITAASSAG